MSFLEWRNMMKKPTDFTRLMTSYLGSYLPLQRNVSQNTISSYCDTFSLLLTFLRDEKLWALKEFGYRIFLQNWSGNISPGLVTTGIAVYLPRTKDWLRYGLFSSMWNRKPAAYASKRKIINIPYAKKEQVSVCYLRTCIHNRWTLSGRSFSRHTASISLAIRQYGCRKSPCLPGKILVLPVSHGYEYRF